jgi:hypothetical protein
MTESMPPTLAQLQQLNRSLTEKVLDKAASDPTWKQQLLDDPEAAMRAANFPELQQVQQIQQSARPEQGAEVRGQSHRHDVDIDIDIERGGFSGFSSIQQWNCVWWTWYWD